MLITNLTTTDPAGAVIAMANAVNRTTGHTSRVISTREIGWMAFQKDLFLPDVLKAGNYDEIDWVLRNSDIIHIHKPHEWWQKYEGTFDISDYLKGKKVIYQHHNPRYCEAHQEDLRREHEARKIPVIGVTPTYLQIFPYASFIPNVVPLWDCRLLPRKAKERSEIVIGHSPTDYWRKVVPIIAEVIEKVAQKVPEVRRLCIQRQSYDSCLRMKRLCDIGIDHFDGFFGISSLEFFAIGIPVIAGLDDFNIEILREFIGELTLPWIIARTPMELERELIKLADCNFRESLGKISRSWMEVHWSEAKIASRLVKLYEEL